MKKENQINEAKVKEIHLSQKVELKYSLSVSQKQKNKYLRPKHEEAHSASSDKAQKSVLLIYTLFFTQHCLLSMMY